MTKILTNGPDEHALYTWMKSTPVGGNAEITWNFTNFIIDRCGRVIARHEPEDYPVDWERELVEILMDKTPC